MVSQYEEWEAAKEAHISLWEWESPGVIPVWFKERVVAHYRLSRAITANVSDAQNKQLSKRGKGSRGG